MTHGWEKCSVCGALLDEEDLFCANCGTEAPPRAGLGRPLATHETTHSFQCAGCGASMAYDAAVQALRCPFCGSQQLNAEPAAKALSPDRIVPFEVDRTRAVGGLRQWLGRGFWRPGDLASSAVVDQIAAVYVPCWIFRARTFTYWSADTDQTPPGARGNWCPVVGEQRGEYAGLLIGASGVLAPQEMSRLAGFELTRARPAGEVPLAGTIVEQFRVPRKYARPLAQQGLEDLERQACQAYVPGSCRNLKVNVRLEELASEPMLVPVWIMAYRYRGQVFRFLINGQTGQATGQAPVSWAKIAVALAIVVLVALLVFCGLAGVVAVSSRGSGVELATPLPTSPEVRGRSTSSRGVGEEFTSLLPTFPGVRGRSMALDRQAWCAKPSCRATTRKAKRIAICARSAWATWWASETCTSVCSSPWMLPASATNPWAISSSTARPAWARPPSPT